MPPNAFAIDPRYFQVIFQSFFLSYGILYLQWEADWLHYVISVGGCLLFSYAAESIKRKEFIQLGLKKSKAKAENDGWKSSSWGFSVLISAMSLCLLLKVNYWYISLLAAFITVASKYIFRFYHKHFFNPSAIGIVATVFLTGDAWLSPGQWGSNAVNFFAVITLGTIVVTRVQKLDVSLSFLFIFVGLLYWRQVFILGWPIDHFLHSVSTGSLLLFTFFMISDPKTSPNHPMARIIWAVLIAVISFYLTAFKWKYNTPIWVLVAAAPLVPVLNKLFKAKDFHWNPSMISLHFLSKFKTIVMK